MDELPPQHPAAVVVVGSANTDVVLRTPRVPHAGETVLATGRADHPGGKGLNQAVAAARAGARTAMVVALGVDAAGDALAEVLAEEGVATDLVRRVDARTGTALITVQDDGDNAIVVDAGANASLVALTPLDEAAIAGAVVLVAQLEVPLAGVLAAARAAAAAGTRVVLNAAPAQRLPEELLDLVDVLVVNEHEAATLVGRPEGGASPEPPEDLAAALLELVPTVVLTLGGAGAIGARRGEDLVRVAAPRVDVVDTTGAGDSAVGHLAAALAAGEDLPTALARAVAAGSLAVQTVGAVPSVPRAQDVTAALAPAARSAGR